MKSEAFHDSDNPRARQPNSRHVGDLLPAFLNGTLDRFNAERVRVHLATCAACQTERDAWETIRRAAQASVATAPRPAPDLMQRVWSEIDRDEAPARRLTLVSAQASPTSFGERLKSMLHFDRQLGGRAFLRPLSVAAAGAALVAAVALTPIGSYAQGFLTIFTPQQFAAVPVTQAELASLPDLSNYGTYTHSSHARPQAATSAAQASSLAGFTVLAPKSLPSGVTGPASYEVMPGQSASFTFNAATARATAAKQGKTLPPMPANVDGSTVQVTSGAGVLTTYGSGAAKALKGDPTAVANMKIKEAQNPNAAQVGEALSGPTLVIGQMVAPTINSTGASVSDLEAYLLAQPGISPDLANAIKSIGDPTTTLPIPIPVGKATSHPVQVQGVTGLSVADSTGLGGGIIWQKNGMIYGVAGTLTENDLIAVANSLQ
jgi:anti-sigma factor RsiW